MKLKTGFCKLSYTRFNYAGLKMDKAVINAGENMQVSFKLKSTGTFKGLKVVQLYIRDEKASVATPIKELKGFQMISLDPGQEKEISFTIH